MLRDSFAIFKKLSRLILDILFIWLPLNTKILVVSLAIFFEPWYFGYLLGPSIDCRTCQWEDPGEEILREGTFQARSLIYWNIEREDQVVWSSFSECLLILLRHPYLWKLLSLHCQQYSLSFHVLPIQRDLQISLLHSTLVSNDHLFGYWKQVPWPRPY